MPREKRQLLSLPLAGMATLTISQENILATLSKSEWLTLQQLSAGSCISLLDLPDLLLGLSERGLVEKKDGQWKRTQAPAAREPSAQRPLVIVDLGNVHDCLQKLVPLAEAGCMDVWAYADLHYNGFGVQPPLTSSAVRVEQARVTHKNAADTKLIWDVALACTQAAPQKTIFVVTKDNGFRHLQELAAEHGHRIVFCESWGSFKTAFEKAS